MAAAADRPDQGHTPTRQDAERAIGGGALPVPGETLTHILAALLRMEDLLDAARVAATAARPQHKAGPSKAPAAKTAVKSSSTRKRKRIG